METTRNIVYFILSMLSIGWGQDCNENMYWSDCGTPYECLPTCSNPYYEPDTCIEVCEIGCFCNSGYVFDDESYSFCVPLENCIETSLCNEETEVQLWGECYNIEETTFINFSYQEGSDYPPLFGEIPSEIGQLVNMTDLFLGGNDLTIIPPEIGNLINLQSLYLYDNQFTSIPSEIGNLTNLITLDIGYNQLSGEIPSELGNLTNLTSLDLGSNQLTGEIPLELGNLDNLYYLNLSDNQLSGQIPEIICILYLETFIGLNWNNLCPPYPDCGSGPITSENSQDTSECYECSFITGDLNDDLTLNIIDVVLMVECILYDYCNECSDINYDGTTNVIDIVSLVDLILET